MTPELRHMLRDDDLNHEEQKQVLELAIKFHHDRFYKPVSYTHLTLPTILLV